MRDGSRVVLYIYKETGAKSIFIDFEYPETECAKIDLETDLGTETKKKHT